MFADAEAYEQYMGRWSRKLAPSFVDFARITDAAKVLDLGCGTGALSMIVAGRSSPTVVGVDLSPEYVAFARTRNDGKQVSFEVSDAQQLPFRHHEFDAALSLLVFNFIPDPEQALAELLRVVRPGGVIAAAVWDYASGMEMLRTFWDEAEKADRAAKQLDEGSMPLCRRGELKELWEGGGLAKVEEGSLSSALTFASFDDFWSPFELGQGPAGAYVRSLDPQALEKLRSRLEHRLGCGPFELAGRAWAVRGIN